MDPILVVSPHLDDAVLSCGQFLASWPGAHVLTIYAGVPDVDEPLTTFDANSGWSTGRDAVIGRWDEDDRALETLGAIPLRGPYLDSQYARTTWPREDIVGSIVDAARAIGATRLFGPLGLAHPDHQWASFSFLDVLERVRIPAWLYEELPARVLYPETVPPALGRVTQSRGREPTLDFVGAGPKDRKRDAVACYRSQLWALDVDSIYVPERFWRVH